MRKTESGGLSAEKLGALRFVIERFADLTFDKAEKTRDREESWWLHGRASALFDVLFWLDEILQGREIDIDLG